MSTVLEVLDAPRTRPADAPIGIGRKRHDVFFAQVVLGVDAIVLVASFLLAYVMRDRFGWYGEMLPLRLHLWVLLVAVVTWLMLARIMGLTDSQEYLWPRRVYWLTLKVHLIGGLTLLSCLYLLRAVEVSRLFMQTFLAVSAGTLLAERMAICETLRRRAQRYGTHAHRMLVIGTNAAAARLQEMFRMRPDWGTQIEGFLTADPTGMPPGCRFGHAPVLGCALDLGALLDSSIIDDVVLATPVGTTEFSRLMRVCVERGVTFHSLAHMPIPEQVRHHAEALGAGLYLMSLETTPKSVGPLVLKRAVDIVSACAGMLFCAVVYVVFGPIIRWTSPGPVIFRQTRVGRNGRLFTMYKLRTMRCDAEAQRAALSEANEMRGPLFKIDNDPRIIGIGRVLRRLYLDELPQFWNVLKGDMSLVGPRPPTVDEVAMYAPRHRRRLSVRPGMTGPWQTTGNGAVGDFEDVVRLECEYIDQWSLWGDLQVMLRTCATVIRMSGH